MIDPNVVDKSGNTNLQRGALKALLSSLKNMLFSPCIIWSRLQQCFMPCWWSGSASCHVRSYSKEEKKEEKIPFLLFVLHSMVQIAVMFHAMLAGGNMSCHVRSHQGSRLIKGGQIAPAKYLCSFSFFTIFTIFTIHHIIHHSPYTR